MQALIDFFPENSIAIYPSAEHWEHAIDLSMASLIDNHAVKPEYSQAIKDATHEIGPYYILAPEIAMPHARPENGVNHTALSLTLLRKGVIFDADSEPVKLLIGLAAKDADSHIYAIQALSEMFCDDESITSLLNATNTENIKDILKRY